MVRIMLVDNHMLMRRVVKEVIEKEDDLEVVAEAGNGLEAEKQAQQVQPDIILMDLDLPGCDAFETEEHLLSYSPGSRVVIFTASHLGQHVILALQRGAIGYITKDIEPDGLVHALRCAIQNDFYIPAPLATHVLTFLRLRALPPDLYIKNSFAPGFEGYNAMGTLLTGRLRRSPQATAIAYRIATRYTTPQLTPPTTVLEEDAEPQVSGTAPAVRCRPLTEREREILDLMRRGRKNKEIAGELCIAESTVHKHVQNIFEKLHARNRAEAIFLVSGEQEGLPCPPGEPLILTEEVWEQGEPLQEEVQSIALEHHPEPAP